MVGRRRAPDRRENATTTTTPNPPATDERSRGATTNAPRDEHDARQPADEPALERGAGVARVVDEARRGARVLRIDDQPGLERVEIVAVTSEWLKTPDPYAPRHLDRPRARRERRAPRSRAVHSVNATISLSSL